MKIQKPKKSINSLKVGKFVKCNGSTLYIYKSKGKIPPMWSSLSGILTIERHPEKTLSWPDLNNYTFVSKPKKKHIDNAIKQVRDKFKLSGIDNLSYIENLNILKNYLKSDIVEIED